MKKIVLSEHQIEKLMSEIISEQVPATRITEHPLDDGRFHITVNCDFNEYHAKYKGGEISDIADVKFDISYLIDIDHNSKGINNIGVYDIRGPKQVKTVIEYYPWDDNPEDEIETETIIIPLDWKRLDIDKDYEMEYFGVDQNVTVYVIDDGQGGLRTKQISITTKEF
jgi:hypothetical protein